MDKLKRSQSGIIQIEGLEEKLVEKFEYHKLTTFVPNKKIPIHRWFPYLQGFSSTLVEKLIFQNRISESSIILDPFCGVGTTLLSSKQKGIQSIGYDISPMAVFISSVKLRDDYNIADILKNLREVIGTKVQNSDLPHQQIFEKSITENNLKIFYTLKQGIQSVEDQASRDFLLLALMSIIEDISLIKKDGAHYRYIPKSQSEDPIKSFQQQVNSMISDLQTTTLEDKKTGKSSVYVGDARSLALKKHSIDHVITSPPYLNRDNYIAQHKLELFLMDFISDFNEYRTLTHNTLRSHVEAKYDSNKKFFMKDVNSIISEIKTRPLSYPKIPEMIYGYFEDMDIVFSKLSRCIKPDGTISFVVGNSAWSGVLIEVDKILSKIAINHGFKIDEIMVTRYKLNSAQQIKKYGKIPIRESIIIARANNL